MTRASGIVFLGLRLVFVVFCVVKSIYCVLAFIPFTYQQVIESQLVSWTVTFVRFHPWMYWIAFVSAAWTLAEDYRPGTRALVVGFLAAGAIAGAALVAFPLLATIKNEPADLVWAAVWLMPLWWLAAIDIFGPGRRLTWSSAQTGEDWRLFWTAVIAGTASAVVYGVIHEVRFGALSGPAPAAPMPIGVGLWSWVLHVLAFLAVFAAFACIRAIASLTRRPALAESAGRDERCCSPDGGEPVVVFSAVSLWAGSRDRRAVRRHARPPRRDGVAPCPRSKPVRSGIAPP